MRHRFAVLALIGSIAAAGLVRDVSAGDDPAKDQIADLVDELRDPDAHVREVARRQLVTLGEKAVPPLVELLRGDASRGRDEAVAILTALGPAAREAAPILAERAQRAEGRTRLPFLRALAEVDPTGSAAAAMPMLLALLDDRDAAVRMDAAQALRAFGPAGAKSAPDVLRRIPYADAPLRSALISAIVAMEVDAASVILDVVASTENGSRERLVSVVGEMGALVVPAAVQRLASEDKAQRAAAAQVLGAAGGAARSAVPQLIAALSDPAGAVRRRAADALGAIGAEPRITIPALSTLLADTAGRAQVEAAGAIARICTAAARQPEDVVPATGTVGRVIDEGLDWLARHQTQGSWRAAGFQDACTKGALPCTGTGKQEYDLGVTGLAALAFLGNGETHQAGPHRSAVQGALSALRGAQDADGCIGPRTCQHWIYDHSIGTLALCEAWRLTQSSAFKEPAQRGVKFLQLARNPYLAWRYAYPPEGDNDTSSTGWAVRALASGRRGGLDVDKEAFHGAAAWVEKMTDPESGRTGYQKRGGEVARTNEMMQRFPQDRSEALTAEAICIRLDAGQDPRTEVVLRHSLDLVASKPPKWDADGSIDLYYWFHGTDALRRASTVKFDAVWDAWRNALVAALLPHQERSGAGCARGSWAPEDPWGPDGGRVYSTSMAVLSLEMCGQPERKPAQTIEVRQAIAALTKALESDDEAVRRAAKSALEEVRSAYR